MEMHWIRKGRATIVYPYATTPVATLNQIRGYVTNSNKNPKNPFSYVVEVAM